ncbi:MAG: hypothetical protein KJ749_01530 [Planctomycetes bacterium]|nr:hypothetical protein [Planctomycetota bacterium]
MLDYAYLTPRVLHVRLTLLEQERTTEEAMVEALRQPAGFTHAVLMLPSWRDEPYAVHHPLFLRALRICQEQGIGAILGNRLWRSWHSQDEKPLKLENRAFDSNHYLAAISVLKSAAAKLPVVGTALDAEIYADAGKTESLKGRQLGDDEWAQIRAAITPAVSLLGPVDLIYPCSSTDAATYTWLMSWLGRINCDEKTYRARGLADLPTINPPAGMTHQVHLWGLHIAPASVVAKLTAQNEKKIPLSPGEYLALDLSNIKRRFPECFGFFTYIDDQHFVEVLAECAKLATCV